jgi:hypothetical protein
MEEMEMTEMVAAVMIEMVAAVTAKMAAMTETMTAVMAEMAAVAIVITEKAVADSNDREGSSRRQW